MVQYFKYLEIYHTVLIPDHVLELGLFENYANWNFPQNGSPYT
jgi:hypothetical protein